MTKFSLKGFAAYKVLVLNLIEWMIKDASTKSKKFLYIFLITVGSINTWKEKFKNWTCRNFRIK